MKKVIVLAGVSGTGKTHARTHDPELKDLPYVDIAEIYERWPEFDWYEVLYTLLKRARQLLQEHEAIVIEGYFLRFSTSRRILVNDMKVAGAKVEFREFWAPFQVCALRITQQWERGEITAPEYRRRIELLKRCWRPQPSARR
jgi:predicted kinase